MAGTGGIRHPSRASIDRQLREDIEKAIDVEHSSADGGDRGHSERLECRTFPNHKRRQTGRGSRQVQGQHLSLKGSSDIASLPVDEGRDRSLRCDTLSGPPVDRNHALHKGVEVLQFVGPLRCSRYIREIRSEFLSKIVLPHLKGIKLSFENLQVDTTTL